MKHENFDENDVILLGNKLMPLVYTSIQTGRGAELLKEMSEGLPKGHFDVSDGSIQSEKL